MVYVERFSIGSLHGSQTDGQRVCLQGELSGWLDVTSGVPLRPLTLGEEKG